MTNDVELLPLPEKSEIDRHLPTGVRVYGYTSDDMRCYASACIAHATAAKDAEIEALTKGLRVAAIALAHASETDATYRPAYQHVSDLLAGTHIADAGNMVEALRADRQEAADALKEAREDSERLDWLASEALQLWGIRDRGWYGLPRINIQSGRECCDPGDLRYSIDQSRGVDAVDAALKQEAK